MKLGAQVGLAPGHIVLDGYPAPTPPHGTAPLQFSARICCGQMAGWIKIQLLSALPRFYRSYRGTVLRLIPHHHAALY